ncbi:MAG: PfkB family carbohydrate kinase, partial [Spirochaetota bacterium]|nr:PfkB family carbohydrate kinase [Spirochaetota bacterium]
MKVLAFGEILWDIIDGREHIGGAPFNCAAHLAQMGAEAAIVSAVGEDERGVRALDEVRRLGIRTDLIGRNPDHPTGIVMVSLDSHGKPTYEIREGSAWDVIELDRNRMEAIGGEEWDVLAFGTLAQRTEGNIRELHRVIDAAAPKELFFDVNLRLDYFSPKVLRDSLSRTTMLKLNDEEVPVISEMLLGGEYLDRQFCEMAEEKWDIHTTVLTRGKEGASVYQEGRYIHVPVVDVRVADTVGAGDSFSAGFLFAY